MEHTLENCAATEMPDGVLAMAFVNMQPFDSVYSLSDGLKAGTIFPDLDKPFLEGREMR
jgi:hypothetical protein